MREVFAAIEGFYNAVTGSPLGTAINLQVWLFAVLQAVHLITLVMIGCAVLVVDLRLIGLGLRRMPVSRVAREARPWLIWGLVGQVLTGLPLFASLALTKYYGHPAFRLKMYVLAAALLFTFLVRQRLVTADAAQASRHQATVVGLVSIALWSTVAMLAKGITYY